MTVTGPQLARRRLRRARSRAVAAQADAVAARVRRRPRRSRRSARTNSPTCAGRRCSTTSSSPRPTSPGSRRKRGRSSAPAAAGSRSTGRSRQAAAERSPNGRRRRSSRAPRCCASRSASKARRSPAASPSPAAVGRPTCSRPRPKLVGDAGARARRLRRRAAQLPGRGARVARLPRLGRPRRLPRARHGPRQDADDARPPARRRGHRPRARDRAARGRRQLDRGGRALHARAARRRAPRRATAPRADEIAAEVADADVVVTTYGTAVRDVDAIAEVDVGARHPRRGAGDQEPGQRHVAAAAPHPRAHAASRSPVRRSRTGSATSGRSSTSPTPASSAPRPQFIAAALERRRPRRASTAEDAMRALNGILVFRRTKAEPAIAAELPDQIDELDHCAMTPEQIGLYQARARHARHRHRLPEGEKPRKGQILAAITALKQICNHPSAYQRRRPPARRSLGQARPARGDRRRGVRGRRDACWCSRTSREWGLRLAEHLTEAHRHAGRVLPRRPVAHRARPDHRRLPGGRRSGRARAVVEGGRHRAEPHRREPRRALRPLVEPRGRRPGARPRVAHRPDPHRHLSPA